jgi:hypothetical protein
MHLEGKDMEWGAKEQHTGHHLCPWALLTLAIVAVLCDNSQHLLSISACQAKMPSLLVSSRQPCGVSTLIIPISQIAD